MFWQTSESREIYCWESYMLMMVVEEWKRGTGWGRVATLLFEADTPQSQSHTHSHTPSLSHSHTHTHTSTHISTPTTHTHTHTHPIHIHPRTHPSPPTTDQAGLGWLGWAGCVLLLPLLTPSLAKSLSSLLSSVFSCLFLSLCPLSDASHTGHFFISHTNYHHSPPPTLFSPPSSIH